MRIQADERSLTITENDILVAGSVLEYSVFFTFPDAWDGYTKSAVFKTEAGLIKETMLVNDQCAIPWEVLDKPQYLHIGVYGVKGSSVRPTLWAERQYINSGTDRDTVPPETTPWHEAIQEMGELVDASQEAAAAAEDYAGQAHASAEEAKIAAGIAVSSDHGGLIMFEIDDMGDLIMRYTVGLPYEFELTEEGELVYYVRT